MANNKLAQGTKELRKRKGLSQEQLAKNSGLSLRTIQRVENGETEPTGETLKRISSSLDVATNELIDWNTNNEVPKSTVRTIFEYLHIFHNKLIISKTPEINISTADYKESIINVFKSLMVFIVSVLIFTTLAIVFYNMGKMKLVVHAGSYSFLFLNLAFFSMLFFSPGSSSIYYLENIRKIKIQRRLFSNVLVLLHEEYGRLKKKYLILEKGKEDTKKNILLSEKLIEEEDVELKDKRINHILYILTFMIVFTPYSLIWKNAGNNVPEWVSFPGVSAIMLSFVLIILMIIKIINLLLQRKTTSKVSV